MKKSITQTVIDAHAGFFAGYPLIVLLFVVVTTAASIYGITQLTFNDDIVELIVSRRERASDEGESIGARTDRALLVMLEADELFTPEALGVIWNTSQKLKEVEGVIGVVSLYDLHTPKRVGRRRTFSRVVPPPDADIERINKAKKLVMEHPMAKEQLISDDGGETLMLLEIEPDITSTRQLSKLGDAINQVVATETAGTSVVATVTGVPAIRVEIAEAMLRDQIVFNIAGPLVAIVIAFVVFRRVASVVIVLAGAGVGVVWTIGVLGLIGEPINPVNAVIAPLALTIGLTDSVHMLMHIREDRAQGHDALRASMSSIRTVGFPSALTSLTSAVGFASLGIAELDVLANFGLCSALAVVLAFISVMTVVPLLGSSMLGDHIQLPEKARIAQHGDGDKWHTHLVIFVVDHRVAMLPLSILVTAAALYVGSHVHSDPRVSHGMPTAGDTGRAFRAIEEDFGGALPMVVTVRWDEEMTPTLTQVYEAIADAHDVLADKEIVGPPLSLVNMYESMSPKDQSPRSLFQQLSRVPKDRLNDIFDSQQRRALVMARCQDAGGQPVHQMLTEVEREFAELEAKYPGFQFRVTDSILIGLRNSTFVVSDLIRSLFMAVPVTLGVLMLALRSFKAGAIALLPNIFPMAALAATIVLSGQSITLTGAAVFVMCFGIAVDDTIHVISAFNRNFQYGDSVRDAIVNTYRELGDAVIATTVILTGGLGVVMLGQSYMTRTFGIMFCIGLAWAVVGDLIILPAVLACFRHKRRASDDASLPLSSNPDV